MVKKQDKDEQQDSAAAADEMQTRCESMLEQVRCGEVDPSSAEAQQLLFTGLMRGWISRQDADAAADSYWDTHVVQCLEEVERGERDPDHPHTQMMLDWGVQSRRITKKKRLAAEAAFAALQEGGVP